MPKHKQSTNTELYYKRTKDSLEIRGNPAMAWFDLVSSRLIKIIFIIALLNIPFQEWAPAIWKYVQNLW